jgi:hypothetical protein
MRTFIPKIALQERRFVTHQVLRGPEGITTAAFISSGPARCCTQELRRQLNEAVPL